MPLCFVIRSDVVLGVIYATILPFTKVTWLSTFLGVMLSRWHSVNAYSFILLGMFDHECLLVNQSYVNQHIIDCAGQSPTDRGRGAIKIGIWSTMYVF